MRASARTVEVESVSEGWLYACEALLALSKPEANHLVIRMQAPLPEDVSIRKAVDQFLSSLRYQPVDEVRNTIFPAEVAADLSDPDDLSADYIEHYEFIKKLGSPQGTYFGRMCAYPRSSGKPSNQLVATADKLRRARGGSRWKSIYEVNIYSELKDSRKQRGFPCMSHLSFHLDGQHLDCLATYRSHDLILKGYGNYLGLAELQRYMAQATGFVPGELVVLAGHAVITLTRAKREELAGLITEHRA